MPFSFFCVEIANLGAPVFSLFGWLGFFSYTRVGLTCALVPCRAKRHPLSPRARRGWRGRGPSVCAEGGQTCALLLVALHALEPLEHAAQVRDAVLEGDALVLRRGRLPQDLPHVLLGRSLQLRVPVPRSPRGEASGDAAWPGAGLQTPPLARGFLGPRPRGRSCRGRSAPSLLVGQLEPAGVSASSRGPGGLRLSVGAGARKGFLMEVRVTRVLGVTGHSPRGPETAAPGGAERQGTR